MARQKSGEFDQIKYQNDFNKQNYDRISVLVPKGEKETIRQKAQAEGLSVNRFIYNAIRDKLDD